MTTRIACSLSALGFALLLAGCGGGGDSSAPVGATAVAPPPTAPGTAPPVTPPPSTAPVPATTGFAVSRSIVSAMNRAETLNFTVSGSVNGVPVTGVGVATFGGLVGVLFESKPVLLNATGIRVSANAAAQLPAMSETYNVYVDSNHQPLGVIHSSNLEYWAVSGPVTIPDSANDGESGRMYGYDVYADQTRALKKGTATVEYRLTVLTPSTALLVITTTEKSLSDETEFVALDSYQVTTTGEVRRISRRESKRTSNLVMTFAP